MKRNKLEQLEKCTISKMGVGDNPSLQQLESSPIIQSRLRHQPLYSAAIPMAWRAAFSCRFISVFRRVIAASNVSALIVR